MKKRPDVQAENHGSVWLLRPLTRAARAWIEAHVSREGFHPDWPTLVIEPRYVGDLIRGARADGLLVRW